MSEKMTPEEGIDALMSLIGKVSEASDGGDSAALESLIGDIGEIVSATGVEIPGLADDLAALQGETGKIEVHSARIDAALWVGDLDRARMLIEGGVPLDYANIVGVEAPDSADWDDITAADEDDEVEAFLAEIGWSDDAVDLPDDPYAEIEAGTLGAIEAFIATGADPNLPLGVGRRPALLAALDAPGRRAEGIAALIEAGADVRVIHFQGDNALSWAAGYHHPETVTPESETDLMRLLADKGANPLHVGYGHHWAPLQRAIIQGDVAQVTGMLAAGGDVTQLLGAGFEPEKLAGAPVVVLAAPKPDVLQLLLLCGADPARRDAKGRLPLDVIDAEAKAAEARAQDDWDRAHATALAKSRDILARAMLT